MAVDAAEWTREPAHIRELVARGKDSWGSRSHGAPTHIMVGADCMRRFIGQMQDEVSMSGGVRVLGLKLIRGEDPGIMLLSDGTGD